MKAKYLHEGMICNCGREFTKRTPNDVWYWCLSCDAHAVACKQRGSLPSKRCGYGAAASPN